MLELITRKKLNEQWWNDIVDKCSNGNVFIYSWYLDVVCHNKWWAIVDYDREIIMPLPVREKWGVMYIYQPKFVQQLGVFSTGKIDANTIQECIDFIPKQVKWVHFNLNRDNLVVNHNQIQEFQTNVILPLQGDIEFLRNNYRMNTKRNVRKAVSHALGMDKNVDPKKIIDLFKQNKGMELESFDAADYLVLQKLMEVLREKNRLISWGALHGTEVIAGAIFIKSHGRYLFLFSGQNDAGKANQGLTFLIDQFIEQHVSTEKILDFEGSSNPNLARYYKGFGGVEEKYVTCKINRLPWYLSFLKS